MAEDKVKRKVFYSFHYQPDNWRAATVRSMGVIEGNAPATDNDWETITSGGDKAINKWIDDQMNGRSCAVVLIGSKTAGRKWINYEIKKAWDDGRGLVGIYIHNLKNFLQEQSSKGANPFDEFSLKVDGKEIKLSEIVKAYNPPFVDSKKVYGHIKDNFSDWVEEAINIRAKY